MLNLDLGSKGTRRPDWTSVDLNNADVVWDLSRFPWPFEESSVDTILASHILEHFPKATGNRFLGECYRILKADSTATIVVPDMDIFVECRLSGDKSALGGYPWSDFNEFLGEPIGDNPMCHRYMYNAESLLWMLAHHGFRNLATSHREGQKWPETISLYVTATK